MQINKILFVGLGGAGQRHARMFKSRLPKDTEFSAFRRTRTTPLLNADFSVAKDGDVESHYGFKIFDTLEAALNNKPDLLVISTPSSLHLDLMLEAAKRGIGVFVEKPATHTLQGLADFAALAREKKLPFFISFQRRHHPQLRRVAELMKSATLGKIISAEFNVASYVPAWHVYEDHKDLYACRKELGGGVLLTEIHEIDLCCWYFGRPDTVFCRGGNFGEEKLDVEDTAHLVLAYQNFSVQINLCFMQRHNRRDFSIAGTHGYLAWNQVGNVLAIEDYATGATDRQSEDGFTNDGMFNNQIDHFLNEFGTEDTAAQLEAAQVSVAVVEAAKLSMTTGRAEPLGL